MVARTSHLVTETSAQIRAEPVERVGPIDRELASTYGAISTLSDLVAELDRRTKPLQSSLPGEQVPPAEDRDPADELSAVARSIREHGDQVEQINEHLRTILGALQT